MRRKWILIVAVFFSMPMLAQNDTIYREYTDTVYRSRIDTVYQPYTDTVTIINLVPDSVVKQREIIIPTDSTDRRGHYIEAHAGFGYGSLGYGLEGSENRVNGSFSVLLQLQYAYFFHKNWGVGAGLWFTNYTSHAHLGGDYVWEGQTDTDYETNYDHTAHINKWKESQTIHNIGIPVSLQFQYDKEDWKARIFASVGVAPAFTVSKTYKVEEGEIAHSGYYPKWNLLLTNMHEFGVKNYENAPQSKGELSVRPQVAFFVDFGALIPMTKQLDIFVGGYMNVAMNNANSSQKRELGWKDATFSFMEEYAGTYATDLASASHPWETGVKIGLHWHYIKPDKHEMEDYFEPFMRRDTVIGYEDKIDTVLIAKADTVIETKLEMILVPTEIKQVAEEVENYNKIYFAFDKYELTNNAKNYLQSIVESLNRVPEAQIMIDGHASSEGQSEYNDILSENRAKAVTNFLVQQGVDKNRIVTAGHGSRIPNADMDHEKMSRDRRVEVKVVYKDNVIVK